MFTEAQAERLVVAFEKIADSLKPPADQRYGHPPMGVTSAICLLADSIEQARPDTETLSAELANVADQIDGIPKALEAIAANLPS